MREVRFLWVDVFTDRPFGGNGLEVGPDLVVMEAPAPRLVRAVDADRISAAVGTAVREPEIIAAGIAHLVARVPSHAALTGLAPDLLALAALARELGFVGACLFALDEPAAGLRARVFAPADAVPEDPATGSAAAPLALYLHRRGLLPPGPFTYVQGVEIGRPSRLWVEARAAGAGDDLRVRVGGQVVLVGDGVFRLP